LGTYKNWGKRVFTKTILFLPGGHPNGYEQKTA
jgi:hypothetical protein